MVVAGYFAISISMVFVNKRLMSSPGATIPAPLFVTWYQCVVTVGICYILGKLGQKAAPGTFLSQFPPVEYDIATGLKVMKLSAMFVGMITFNNLCLKYVEVSFYNVARSLTIVFNVMFSQLILGEQTSRKVMGCLVVVCLGFYLGTEGEVNFSLIGTLFGVSASCFVSLNSIYTKRVSGAVQNNKWKLAAYNNINACILFVPLMILQGEVRVILASWDIFTTMNFWFLMTVGGVFGFMIGIMSILQIQVTSPLTHNISGTAKAAVQSILALYIFGNPTTAANLAGIAIVLGGSLAYSYIRREEMAEAQKAALDTMKATEAELAPMYDDDDDDNDIESRSRR